MQILTQIGLMWFLLPDPKYVNITVSNEFFPDNPVVLSQSRAHVEQLDRFSRFVTQTTGFHAKRVIWGYDNG